MKKKKLLSIILVGVTTLGLMSGCGASGNTTSSAGGSTSPSTSDNTSDDSTAATDTENSTASVTDGKTLVVYYSATGTTKGVAETIAQVTGGDLFEIEPKEPYTSDDLDWTNDDSRVSREHEDESLRDVELTTTDVADWDSYDIVYIGA